MREIAPEEPRARRSRRIITDRDAAGWLSEIEAGAAPSELAKREHLQPRTIRVHVKRAREIAARTAVQRDMLRTALQEHHKDLERTVTRLRETLGVPPTQLPDGKLLTALLTHTAGSGLPYLVRRWQAIARQWAKATSDLQTKLKASLAQAELDPQGGFFRLREVARDYVAGREPARLAWMIRDGGGLNDGAVRIAAGISDPDDPKALRARQRFEQLRSDLRTWPEVIALERLYRVATKTRGDLSSELEDITLRRYFSGECPWCPGARPRKPRTAQT
jgi:hypothetical protein